MMPLRPDSYRPAMPVGRGGFGQGRNHSFRFSRPSALLTVKNANSTKWQSHFVDTLTEEHGSSPPLNMRCQPFPALGADTQSVVPAVSRRMV